MRKSIYTIRYAKFLEVLKSARLAANLTQAEAAHALKKPQSFVSKCESGERRVDVIELSELCKVYKTKAELLIRAIEETEKN